MTHVYFWFILHRSAVVASKLVEKHGHGEELKKHLKCVVSIPLLPFCVFWTSFLQNVDHVEGIECHSNFENRQVIGILTPAAFSGQVRSLTYGVRSEPLHDLQRSQLRNALSARGAFTRRLNLQDVVEVSQLVHLRFFLKVT